MVLRGTGGASVTTKKAGGGGKQGSLVQSERPCCHHEATGPGEAETTVRRDGGKQKLSLGRGAVLLRAVMAILTQISLVF